MALSTLRLCTPVVESLKALLILGAPMALLGALEAMVLALLVVVTLSRVPLPTLANLGFPC